MPADNSGDQRSPGEKMDAAYDAILGSLTLRQVRKSGFQPQAKTQAGRVSGGLDASALFLKEAQPRAMFTSGDIAGVIAGLSLTAGLSVVAGTITIPYNRRANGGTFAGGSSNFTLTGANGLILPRSISASQGEEEGASADIEVIFLSTDGLTAPVAANVNQALGSQAFNAMYAMGPVYIGGSQLTQVQSIKVDTGLQATVKLYDGTCYPTITFIQQRDPAIEVTFENFDALSSNGPLFATLGSGCAAYFRKKASHSTFTSDASTVHCKLSFADGLASVESAEASGTDNGSATIRLNGLALVGSAASAIP